MKQLNLDDYGLEAFTAEALQPLMSWQRGRKVDPRKYKHRFNLRRGYGEKEPFIWTERLADWRHLETLHHRCQSDQATSSSAYWDYLKVLWKRTQAECGKKVQGYYLQQLRPGKRSTSYLLEVHRNRDYGKDSIATTHRQKKEAKAGDASFAWIWLGTPEEKRANLLEARAQTCSTRSQLAQTAFQEAVKIRLASWLRQDAKASGLSEYDYEFRGRKVFTAIENEGRSYGWISGMGGPGELVWSPHHPPTFFK